MSAGGSRCRPCLPTSPPFEQRAVEARRCLRRLASRGMGAFSAAKWPGTPPESGAAVAGNDCTRDRDGPRAPVATKVRQRDTPVAPADDLAGAFSRPTGGPASGGGRGRPSSPGPNGHPMSVMWRILPKWLKRTKYASRRQRGGRANRGEVGWLTLGKAAADGLRETARSLSRTGARGSDEAEKRTLLRHADAVESGFAAVAPRLAALERSDFRVLCSFCGRGSGSHFASQPHLKDPAWICDTCVALYHSLATGREGRPD